MAGGTGSGKSTLSAAVERLFNHRNTEKMKVIPLYDGFHYSQSQLATLNFNTNECPFQRHGAPFTFNSPAFIQPIQKLRQTPVTEEDQSTNGIWAPSFDHAAKDPVNNDIYIPFSQRIILLEGNYLLLNEKPWNEIRDVVDETWFVDVSREETKKRLIKRHIEAGVESTWDAAALRVENNDLLNLDLVGLSKGCSQVIISNSSNSSVDISTICR
ncbi:P-loop containing nucleoside triphosphate hydrolase [Glarea lozoyensis ATCC 20868]|uniref:p-loop containing nucleoside triphosphate hydrolase n=1 Tax=Glarea lozoyensis (strain ATCC 20868 / MF5171) TaxID=1116229 RepID=S3DER4_GLAL2|nr:P-loop containing nucleoside triphosphate hydrolase [Glarea lozoyensis ATCC 20868]EPE25148.1 P-loop containing nucleoside triphosphate hydrolase [Glarea lozoyensis ATCC 20868]